MTGRDPWCTKMPRTTPVLAKGRAHGRQIARSYPLPQSSSLPGGVTEPTRTLGRILVADLVAAHRQGGMPMSRFPTENGPIVRPGTRQLLRSTGGHRPLQICQIGMMSLLSGQRPSFHHTALLTPTTSSLSCRRAMTSCQGRRAEMLPRREEPVIASPHLTREARERCPGRHRTADTNNLDPRPGTVTVTPAMRATRGDGLTEVNARILSDPHWNPTIHRCSQPARCGSQIPWSELQFRLLLRARQASFWTTHHNRALGARPFRPIKVEG